MHSFASRLGWSIVDTIKLPSRQRQVFSYSELPISQYGCSYLRNCVPDGIYLHQKEAIKAYLNNENVCLVTGTASGKSLAFYTAGLEALAKNPTAKVLAIYPMKSLGKEQEERWIHALQRAGLDAKVGRIDGQVSGNRRIEIIKKCRVIIMTPDVIHAWLLSNLSDKDCLAFIKAIDLLVVDEVHTYTGVFGSNSAFLYRRLRHLMGLYNKIPRVICASATILRPEDHLAKLFGLTFSIIGSDLDTSPKFETDIVLLEPPNSADFLTEVSRFLLELSNGSNKFITFVDSRKQTELLASILSREASSDEDDEIAAGVAKHLSSLNILPYRAGYEEMDRDIIQSRLSQGSLQGIVSTSALELGLDIPYLDTGVLIGVPYSATSFVQRIGRIGRHKKGIVYVIKTGNVFDEIVFKDPKLIFKRPLSESTLYLKNTRIQYIHALCLARSGGEHDQMLGLQNEGIDDTSIGSSIEWPEEFIELCNKERVGEIPADLQSMKSEAGEDPNHIYPLRDVESQYKVELKQGPEQRQLGSLSHSQVLREAYPGAVYYYTANAYRVYKVNTQAKHIYVRKEKKYTTSPIYLPTLVFPSLSTENVYSSKKHGELFALEANLQIRESICGYKERKGPNQINVAYPLRAVSTNIYFDLPRFTRNYFTSGVIFTHPGFNDDNIQLEHIARMVYEAFLISIPFERQDLDFAVDRHRVEKLPHINKGDRFIAIYDKTYGSLRLSGHVMQEDLMAGVFSRALEIADLGEETELNKPTLDLFKELSHEALLSSKSISLDEGMLRVDESLEVIIMPGSVGTALNHNNEEYSIESVFVNPRLGGLCYRGRYTTQRLGDTSQAIFPISAVAQIPGESVLGYYNYETGEIVAGVYVQELD